MCSEEKRRVVIGVEKHGHAVVMFAPGDVEVEIFDFDGAGDYGLPPEPEMRVLADAAVYEASEAEERRRRSTDSAD